MFSEKVVGLPGKETLLPHVCTPKKHSGKQCFLVCGGLKTHLRFCGQSSDVTVFKKTHVNDKLKERSD